MLAIRLKRLGRKGQAQYRFIVQDSHRSPHGGKVIDYLGNYNPHTKEMSLDKELAQKFIDNGAKPSDRVVALLTKGGVKLPTWVTKSADKKRKIRNPEKLRKNQPKEEVKAPAVEAEIEEVKEEAAPEAEAPVVEAAPEEKSEAEPAVETAEEPTTEPAKEA